MSNTVKVEIQNDKGKWCTWKNVVLPVKYGNLLDEQLDYATVSLLRVRKESFKPLTKARITVISNTDKFGKQSVVNDYFIAKDDFYESPIGQNPKEYNHTLTLIELTKFLECFPLENLCFTNPSGTYSASLPITPQGAIYQNWQNEIGVSATFASFNPQGIIAPIKDGVVFNKYTTVLDLIKLTGNYYSTGMIYVKDDSEYYGNKIILTDLSGTIIAERQIASPSGYISDDIYAPDGFYKLYVVFGLGYQFYGTENTLAGQVVICYDNIVVHRNLLPLKPWTINDVIQRILQLVEPIREGETPRFSYEPVKKVTTHSKNLICWANEFPVSHFVYKRNWKWQIDEESGTYYVEVTFPLPIRYARVKFDDQADALYYGGTPELLNDGNTFHYKSNTFQLIVSGNTNTDGEYEYTTKDLTDVKFVLSYDDIEIIKNPNAPEFTFTRQNLREALQTIGGFIHAEPRLHADNTITFDFYGEQEYATVKCVDKNGKEQTKRLSEYKYKALRGSYGIEQACTRLDSYVDNLVNRVSWQNATVGQPFKGGGQTLRTENAYIRGEENEGYYFPTAYPIDKIEKFEYLSPIGIWYDITPYVYEKTIYDNLSSYDDLYPTSKAYALYYTHGQKGINGFFFKPPSAFANGAFNNYAIKNILEAAVSGLTVDGYTGIRLRLTYTPIYSTRVQHGKQYINDYLPLPRTLNYAQSENSVESRFFGENIKGTVERLGNIEKTYTINLRNVENIPKAGQLWDDEYYIASVSVSVGEDLLEVSVGLSKNFNRKSQYIGASTHKRIYEVSETMVQQRHTVYTDYIVITSLDTDITVNDNLLLNPTGLTHIANIFLPDSHDDTVVAVNAFGQSKAEHAKNSENYLGDVILPVVASAFGNTIEFTWEYKNNFSAGVRSVQKTGASSITGVFGSEVEYADYYGRMYYYYFSLLTTDNISTYLSNETDEENSIPRITTNVKNDGVAGTLPKAFTDNDNNAALIDRKDSREAEKKSYVIDFVTDDNSFIIGSAFASKNPLVYFDGRQEKPHLYVLPYRVNKFATHVDLTDAKDLGTVNVSSNNLHVEKTLFYVTHQIVQNLGFEGQAWAYAFPEYSGDEYEVEDEDGNITLVKPHLGGELVLAKNGTVQYGDAIGGFKAYAVHDVFNYIKAKNNN